MFRAYVGQKLRRPSRAGSAFPVIEERRPILKVCAAVGFSMVGALAVVMLDRPATSNQSPAKDLTRPNAQGKASRLDLPPSKDEQVASALPPTSNAGGAYPASEAQSTPAAPATSKGFALAAPQDSASSGGRVAEVARSMEPAPQRADDIWPAPSGRSESPQAAPAIEARKPAVVARTEVAPQVAALQPKSETAARTEASPAQAAPDGCLVESARKVLAGVQSRFSGVVVVSTTHLHTDNHSPGSIREKLHHACKAVDIKANAAAREVIAFLRAQPEVGGVNSYRNGVIHFDVTAAGGTAATQRSGGRRRGQAAAGQPVEPAPSALGFVHEDKLPGGD